MARQDLQWVKINDFSPGIISNSSFTVSGNISGALPPGSAQETGTVGCCTAGPSHALAPLPAIPTPSSITMTGVAGATHTNYLTELKPLGAVGEVYAGTGITNTADYLIYIVYQSDTGTTALQSEYLQYVQPPVSLTSTNLITENSVAPIASNIAPTMFTSGGISKQGVAANLGGSANIYVFPDPAAYTTDTPATVASTYTNNFVIGHEQRVLVGGYATQSFGTQSLATNTNLQVTDPPLSTTLTAQFTYNQEYPGRFGAWGSVSTAELLLIKQTFGALQVSGDLINPTIIKLPAVTPTGNLIMEGVPTSKGLFYLSRMNGAWIWNGGNTSQPVSKQLRDDFFENTSPSNKYFAGVLENWVFTSAGWVWDTESGGWWRISTNPLFHVYCQSWMRGTTFLWAAPKSVVGTNVYPLYKLDATVPGTSYTWQGHAIPETVANKVDVLEIELTATNPNAGTATIVVTLTAADGSNTPVTFTLPASMTQPSRVRLPIGVQGYNVVPAISVTQNGSHGAPIIYELALGYVDTHSAAAT
jgi:hypothetical protein